MRNFALYVKKRSDTIKKDQEWLEQLPKNFTKEEAKKIWNCTDNAVKERLRNFEAEGRIKRIGNHISVLLKKNEKGSKIQVCYEKNYYYK